jgi:hypothetical protein
MINFNGKKFAENNNEFMGSLFHTGGTCSGYARKIKRGVKLFNLQNELFAFIVAPKRGENAFIVTASIQDGKARYMYSTCSLTEKYLGIDNMGYMDTINACGAVFRG